MLDHLDDIYRRVGLFVTEQVSMTKPGSEGMAQIKAAMARFRGAPPTEHRRARGRAASSISPRAKAACPPSDVLVFKLAGGRRVIMRPSGTEPKLKSYYEVRIRSPPANRWPTRGRAASPSSAQLRDAHQKMI